MKRWKYIQSFTDRHGTRRYYVRRSGFPLVSLPGDPGHPDFRGAYEAALAGQKPPVARSSIISGSLRALAISYFGSVAFLSMKISSRSVRRNIIERFCRETDPDGVQNGDKRVANLRREHITRFMAARSEKPESANGLRKALRALMAHAVEIGLRADDPTRDVKAIRVKSDGYHTWTEDEILEFQQCHPIASRARLAFALLLYTGQRRSDVVRMGRQQVRDGVLHLKQTKGGTELAIPIHPDLQATIAASKAGHLTFLTTEFGKPFTPAGFSNWFREQCNAANLRRCSAHGLRKAKARRLAEAGCTAHEIAAITGHGSLREVERYTKAADQQRLARAAMDKVKAGTSSVKPDTAFDKKRKSP